MPNLSVDIVTPSYNQAEFIRDTIESVANQTYQDITHHVIDGGSDDGTLDILREYDDLEWVSEDDRGQTHAINKGFERVDADIVGWLNSDDPLVFTRTVDRAVSAFERTSADVLVGHSITIGPNNELRRVHHIPRFDPNRIQLMCYLFQPSVFFRSEVVRDNKLDESRDFSMDYEFWLRLAERDYDWAHAGCVLSADRNHPERKIIAQADESRRDTQQLRNQLGIDQGVSFRVRQTLEKLRLRGRRLLAVPTMIKLLHSPEEVFAFDLQRRSLSDSLQSQLMGRKRSI